MYKYIFIYKYIYRERSHTTQLKIYYKVLIIKIVWNWQEERHIDQ